MALVEDKLKVDRLINLVQGFGWRVAKQETTDDKIIVTLETSRSEIATAPEAGAT